MRIGDFDGVIELIVRSPYWANGHIVRCHVTMWLFNSYTSLVGYVHDDWEKLFDGDKQQVAFLDVMRAVSPGQETPV